MFGSILVGNDKRKLREVYKQSTYFPYFFGRGRLDIKIWLCSRLSLVISVRTIGILVAAWFTRKPSETLGVGRGKRFRIYQRLTRTEFKILKYVTGEI
ncbi:MAG TPA: hypothetical protein PLI90_11980 [Rhodocyclaceae bacterium]|nr:hypothetical protein [Rhodocyclaceae bacterium]